MQLRKAVMQLKKLKVTLYNGVVMKIISRAGTTVYIKIKPIVFKDKKLLPNNFYDMTWYIDDTGERTQTIIKYLGYEEARRSPNKLWFHIIYSERNSEVNGENMFTNENTESKIEVKSISKEEALIYAL